MTYGSSYNMFGTSDPTMGADWNDSNSSCSPPQKSPRERLREKIPYLFEALDNDESLISLLLDLDSKIDNLHSMSSRRNALEQARVGLADDKDPRKKFTYALFLYNEGTFGPSFNDFVENGLGFILEEIENNRHNIGNVAIKYLSSLPVAFSLRPHRDLFVKYLEGGYEEDKRAYSALVLGRACNSPRLGNRHKYDEKDKTAISALKRASRCWLPFRGEYEHSGQVRRCARQALSNIDTRAYETLRIENRGRV